MDITPGKYRHYKGNEYEVVAVARHSENGERLVVYRAVRDPEEYWVRPLEMFAETVTIEGVEQLRFTPIDQ